MTMPDETVEPIEIRRNPENPAQAAYRTADNVMAGDWFVFTAANGGAYSDGVNEGCAEWPTLIEGSGS